MLLTQIAMALFLHQGAQAATVTYSNPAQRLELLFPALSKAAGISLIVDPRIADVVLTLRLDHISIKEMLERVAEVTRGTWEQKGQALELFLDSDDIVKDQQAALIRHSNDIHAMFETLHSPIEPKDPSKKEDNEEKPQPVDVVIAKLLPFISESAIAGLDVFHRIVYSTHPSPVQLPLPEGSEQLFETLLDAERKEAVRTGRADIGFPSKGVPFKTDVQITRQPKRGEELYGFKVSIYDRSGHVISRDGTSGWIPQSDDEEPVVPNVADSEKAKHQDRAIKIPKLMQTRLTLIRDNKLQDEIVKIISNPLKNDPLEPVGSVLVAYADLEKLQLVACITDSYAASAPFGDDDSLSESEVQRFLRLNNFKIKAGWLTLKRPIPEADDFSDRSQQVDRHALQDVVDHLHDKRCPMLFDLIRAFRMGFPLVSGLEQENLYPIYSSFQNSELFDLLSKLDDSQIQSLLTGSRAPLSQAPILLQSSLIATVLDNYESYIQVDYTSEDPGDDYRSESTEVVQGRTLPGAFLQLSEIDDVGFERPSSVHSAGDYSMPYLDLPMLANQIRFDQHVGRKFRVGIVRAFELRLYIGPQSYYSEAANIFDIDESKPFVTMSEFSAEIKKKLADLASNAADIDSVAGRTTPP